MDRKAKALTVAGVMSGTSADGVDVALVRVSPGAEDAPKVKVLGHSAMAYPAEVRDAVLCAMNATETSVAELSRLHWRLGEVYAEAVARACRRFGLKPALVGMHGQTIYHQATAERYAGRSVRATWQIGEAAVVRERLGVPVVSDFRPADLAAGGQGAPLVPMLDYCMFRSKTRNRVLLNLGGIANVTAMPAGAGLEGLIAFDTGPANMVIDALMQQGHGQTFDRAGRVAARGQAKTAVIVEIMRGSYFQAQPPKSCGREQFGRVFVERFARMCSEQGASAEDEVATATELTAATVIDAYGRFCWSHLGQWAPNARGTDVIAAGGGTKNTFLMARLQKGFAELGVKLLVMEDLGVKSQAKESAAFALLAWLSWHGLGGNVPSATGALGARVLGKVTC